ncbi:MAG TPA: OmpW family outer membrane protein [Telluria sp.]|jgi:outer membrane protein
MKLRLHSALTVLAALAAMAVAQGAAAQAAGQWTVKGGLGKITPKVTSGDVSAPALPGSKGAVSADTKPIFAVTYGLTDNISLELDLGLPYKHEISGAGAIEGVGVIGTVKSLPPTLFAHYRFFKPDAQFRPYAGLGATYAYFASETGSGRLTTLSDIGGPPTTFSIKNKLAPTLQIGVVWALNERWFIDGNISKTWLKTKVSFSSGQTQDMQLDPQAVTLGVGYKF